MQAAEGCRTRHLQFMKHPVDSGTGIADGAWRVPDAGRHGAAGQVVDLQQGIGGPAEIAAQLQAAIRRDAHQRGTAAGLPLLQRLGLAAIALHGQLGHIRRALDQGIVQGLGHGNSFMAAAWSCRCTLRRTADGQRSRR